MAKHFANMLPRRWLNWNGWWLEVNRCLIFFFLISLFFGLLCRAGFPIVSHSPLKEESNLKKAFRDFSYKHIPNKETKKQHSQSSKLQVDLDPEQITAWIHTAFWSVGSSRFSFTMSRNDFVFTWIFLSIYLHHSHREPPGRQGATSKGGLNIQVCTCSLKGHEVCNVKIKQRLCLKRVRVAVVGQLLFCCCFLSFLFVSVYGAGFCSARPGQLSVSERISPVSFAASNH